MNDLEHDLPVRLSALADELTRTTDLAGQAVAARGRYRRQRRTRAGLAAVAVAVVAIGIGVPTALGSLSSAPATGGGTAGLRPPASATTSDSDAEARARLAALEAAQAAASSGSGVARPTSAEESAALAQAQEHASAAQHQAELAEATGRLGTTPLVLATPTPSTACPDAGNALGAALDVPLQTWQGTQVEDDAPCEWGGGPQLAAPIPDRLALDVQFLPGGSVVEQDATIAANGLTGQCTSAPVPGLAAAAVVRRCTNGQQVDWDLLLTDAGRAGLWQLSAHVGQRYTAVTGGQALAALAEVARATWGS